MDPRLRRGAALAVLFTVAPAVAAGAAVATLPTTTSTPALTGLCWMGQGRPIFRARNTSATASMSYVLHSGSASRTGSVDPAQPAGTDDVAYFVGTGTFPNAGASLDWTVASTSGTVQAPGADGRYCTYNVEPTVRWLDAAGHEQPAPASAPGLVLTVEGPIERLVCTWSNGALDCLQQALPDAPLPPGSYPPVRSELQVPAFTAGGQSPAYTVGGVAPTGYQLVAGTGRTLLVDLGTGLNEANVDQRMGPFLPLKADPGNADRTATIVIQADATTTSGAAGPPAGPSQSNTAPPGAPSRGAPSRGAPSTTAGQSTAAKAAAAKAAATQATKGTPPAPAGGAQAAPTTAIPKAPTPPTTAPASPLPRTGASPFELPIAAALLAGGLVTLVVARRRSAH